MLQSIFQLNLLASKLVKRRLLGRSFGFKLLDLPHKLVDEALLLLLQCVLKLNLLLSTKKQFEGHSNANAEGREDRKIGRK